MVRAGQGQWLGQAGAMVVARCNGCGQVQWLGPGAMVRVGAMVRARGNG